MSSRRQSFSMLTALLALAAMGACNAILGIEAGELVEGDAGLSGQDASMEGGPESGGMGGGGRSATGGGGGTAGSGGSSGRGGSGGGSAGAGGSTGGTSGSGGGVGVSGSVICGETECDTQSSGCCIQPASVGMMPSECMDNVGTACPDGVPATCDGPSDCATGEECCIFIDLLDGSVRIECAPECIAMADTAATVVECLGARNCAAPQSCCITPDGFGCGDTCAQTLCQSDADCTAGEPCVATDTSLPTCGGPQTGTIQCGFQICDRVQNLLCCADPSGMGTVCQTMCPAGTKPLACDGHEDCPGSMCCGNMDTANSVIFGTSCSVTGTGACGLASFPLACNGQHNCPPETNCCFIDNASGSACLAEACANSGYFQLCATNDECGAGQICTAMTSATGQPFGLRACL